METTTSQTTNTKMVHRRRLQGEVVKAAMKDTVTVRVERIFQHRRIKRVMRRSRKYLVHDPGAMAKVGDVVAFEETRPLSKLKRHRIVEILRAASTEEILSAQDEEISETTP